MEEIIEDGNLKNNAEIQQLTKQSEDFIQTKHNFWAQQGDSTLRKKASVKRPPQPLSNTLTQSQDISKSQITELDNKQLLARVLQKIQQSQQLLNQNEYTQSLQIMQTVEKQAQQVQINAAEDPKFVLQNQKTRLMTDAYTLIGCIYWRLNQLDLALQQYAQALDQAYNYQLMPNPNLAPNKREQQLYEKQVAEQKALTVRSLRCIYQCCMAQNYY